MYKCLYNLELLILATAKTPWQDYDQPIQKDSPANFVRRLEGTDVDALMICPTAWKRVMWHSKVDPHWEKEAAKIPTPYFTADLKYHEKAYFRLRDYMLAGNDPVAQTVEQAKKQGIAPFISFRMNEAHWHLQESSPMHSSFWKNNPQFRISENNKCFNYIHAEVRDHYFALLSELVENYDVAGLELDFMRHPFYFSKEDLDQGREIMTGFIARVRQMLNEWGAKRNKKLQLSVRVPCTVKWANEVGLDVGRWDREGLIDMVNISPFFMSSTGLDVSGYKSIVNHAATYGEIHFILENTELRNGFINNCTRKMNRQMYRALAATFLDEGFDGISLFNFDYTGHHFFNEPRRNHLKEGLPPHDVLVGITNPEQLAKQDKHYFVGPYYTSLPMKNTLDLDIYIADTNPSGDFGQALLRIKTEKPCECIEIEAQVNGVPVEEVTWMGELFPPQSIEGVAKPEQVKYYKVPVEILKHGNNHITAQNKVDECLQRDRMATYNMVELALYKNNPFLS